MVILFFMMFKVMPLTQIAMNLFSNIIVSSLVFFLGKFFTPTNYMLHTFSTLSTHLAHGAIYTFVNMVLDIVRSECLFLGSA